MEWRVPRQRVGLPQDNVIPNKAHKNLPSGNHALYNAAMKIWPKRRVILVPAHHENTKGVEVKLQRISTSSLDGNYWLDSRSSRFTTGKTPHVHTT